MNKVAIINTSHAELDTSLIRDLNDENNSFQLLSPKGRNLWDNLNSLEDTQRYNHLLIGHFEKDKIINLTSIFKKRMQTAAPPDQLFIAFSPNGKKANVLKLIIQKALSISLNTGKSSFIFENDLSLLISTKNFNNNFQSLLQSFSFENIEGVSNHKTSLLEYLRNIYSLVNYLNKELLQFFLFGCVGISGMIIDLSVVTFLKEAFSIDTRLCSILSFPVALTTNYIFNRKWTFESTSTPFFAGYMKYFAVNIFGLITRVWTIHFILYLFPGFEQKFYIAVTMCGILIAFFINFFASKFLVFSKK